MMRILIIKTSSLGDVIHTLPALTDVATVYPGVTFDWVVEAPFQEVPAWHSAVRKVIPISWRQWRKNKIQSWREKKMQNFVQSLRQESYDYVIDAQGLIKSALFSLFSKGKRIGLDWNSAREPLASFLYHKKIEVAKKQHAVERVRMLFAKALNYADRELPLDYGITERLSSQISDFPFANYQPYCVFLHGTTWPTKHWPETYWRQLAEIVCQNGLQVLLPWGNETEHKRATLIAENLPKATVLPKMSLSQLAGGLLKAKGIIAVDTGLGHLAAALAIPTVSLYGPTDASRTGTMGHHQTHLSAEYHCAPCLKRDCPYSSPNLPIEPPCFTTLPPELVWKQLQEIF